ncbi:hypothetical protein QOZ80_6BG0478930 [Eleusine coracana subsp. coracana]|nr:hypothetical protein QOZ80_6BG0478930 [Eleusine coracana subsp. coracana]
MATWKVHRDSFNPPALSAADDVAAEETLPWVLVELDAYVAKRENATTAYATTRNGKQIQVTFCLRRPPLVSYLCVHSPDAEIPVEPTILATQDDIVLLRIIVGSEKDVLKEIDYYIYKADDGAGKPSLKHLKRPSRNFSAANIGILPYWHQPEDSQIGGILKRHHLPDSNKDYILAGFLQSALEEPSDWFTLFLYDSKAQDWRTYKVTLDQQQQQQWGGDDFYHKNCKVMAIGDGTTMAFVDLWRGILLCNLHQVEKEAHLHGNGQPLPVL